MKKENLFSFMRQVTAELQGRGNLGTAHVYKSTLNAILTFQGSEKLMFRQLTSEWVKRFEISLRERGCSWNTVSTYLRTLRAVYNRAVDRGKLCMYLICSDRSIRVHVPTANVRWMVKI